MKVPVIKIGNSRGICNKLTVNFLREKWFLFIVLSLLIVRFSEIKDGVLTIVK